MISFSDLKELLENRTDISFDGRVILQNALISGKAFTIWPATDRKSFDLFDEKSDKPLVSVSFSDFCKICDVREEDQRMVRALLAEGYEAGMIMNAYPDDEYDRKPDGRRITEVVR